MKKFKLMGKVDKRRWWIVEGANGTTEDHMNLLQEVIRTQNAGKCLELDPTGTQYEGGHLVLLPTGKMLVIAPPENPENTM